MSNLTDEASNRSTKQFGTTLSLPVGGGRLPTDDLSEETYRAVFGDGDHFEAIRNALR